MTSIISRLLQTNNNESSSSSSSNAVDAELFRLIESIRAEMQPRFGNITYVDFAGASLPTKKQLDAISNLYLSTGFSNPHSLGRSVGRRCQFQLTNPCPIHHLYFFFF
jgi:hypothetical protein